MIRPTAMWGPLKMPDYTDLDPGVKDEIDKMNLEQLEMILREEDPTGELRQGIAGEYFEERYMSLSGQTADDFYRQEALSREEDREMEDAKDDEVVEDVEDGEEGEDEEVGQEDKPTG